MHELTDLVTLDLIADEEAASAPALHMQTQKLEKRACRQLTEERELVMAPKRLERSAWLWELGLQVVHVMRANEADTYFDFYSPAKTSGNEADAFLELGAVKKFPDTRIELLLAGSEHWGRLTYYHNPNAYPDLLFSFVTQRRRAIREIARTSNLFFPSFQTEPVDNIPVLELGTRGESNSLGVTTSYVPVFSRPAEPFLAMDIAFFFYIIGRAITVPTAIELRQYGPGDITRPITPPSRYSIHSLSACPICRAKLFAWARNCDACNWTAS